MKIGKVGSIFLIISIVSILGFSISTRTQRAGDTIYIRLDGSIDPPDAPIQRVADVYILTADINDSIAVEPGSIVLDGNHFKLQGSGTGTGVILPSTASNVTIRKMFITGFNTGIWMDTGNIVLENNVVTNNSLFGITSDWGHSVTVQGNVLTHNGHAINYYNNVRNTWINNTITNNSVGIGGHYLSSTKIVGNNISDNTRFGIELYDVSGNTLTKNSFERNNVGISTRVSISVTGNKIVDNTFAHNKAGLELRTPDVKNNFFYHNNFINNDEHVNGTPGPNYWDNGYPSGGNFWSNYTDVDLYSGPNQDEPGSDGIWDHPYVLNDHNIDYYPLNNPIPPHFDVTISPSSGTAVHGTDLTTTVSVSATAGYGYLVSLSASDQPAGVLISFSPETGTPYFTSTMTIQVGTSVPPNTYPINITGVGADGKTHSTTYTLTIPIPDFDVTVSPSTDTTTQGTTVTTNVYVSAIAGYDYLVSLSASGQPEGITINFNPSTGTPDFTSTMTIQVGYTVPPNTYTITVTGLGSDGKTHSTTYTLSVTTVAVPEFPLGLTIEIAFIPVIIYILWRSKQRKKTSL